LGYDSVSRYFLFYLKGTNDVLNFILMGYSFQNTNHRRLILKDTRRRYRKKKEGERKKKRNQLTLDHADRFN